MDIYAENIMDHFKNPRNCCKMNDPDASQKEFNPLCGDEVEMHLKVEENTLVNISFEGTGCAISQASASLVTDYLKGKSIEEINKFTREDVLELLGIPIGPVRLKCALLSFHAVMNGLKVIGGQK